MKQVIGGVGAASVLMLMLGNLVEEERKGAAAEGGVPVAAPVADAKVAAHLADPFALASQQSGSLSQPSSSSGPSPDPRTTGQGGYGLGLQVAQAFAAEYATYSHDQTPAAFVDGLPYLTDEGREELLAAASRSWPDLQAQGVRAQGRLLGIAPVAREMDVSGYVGVVEVTVQQTVSGSAGEQVVERDYAVTLTGSGDESQPWAVAGVVETQ